MKNFIQKLRYIKNFKFSFWTAQLIKYQIPINDVYIGGEDLIFKYIDVCLNKTNYHFVLKTYNSYLKWFSLTGKVTFSLNDDNLVLTYDGQSFILKSEVDLWIFKEIYFQNTYNINIQGSLEVIDIGMNIGIASLYFASFYNVNKVYGFEPFELTYNDALYNFKQNPTLGSKIQAYNFGLGNSNRSQEFFYDPSQKGNMGIIHSNKDDQIVTVQIKDTSEVLTAIFKDASEVNFIAKIDCEGAEYEIIDSLYNSGLLKKIDIFIIEWHKTPDFDEKIEIVKKQFIESGYSFYLNGTFHYTTGFIFAQRMC